MATSGQGGFGVPMTIDGTALVQILDVDFPAFSKVIAEATGHDSAGGYYEAVASGKRRIEPLTLTLAWDAQAATHGQVLGAFNADTPSQFTISDPDGDESIEFLAHVERLGRMSQQEDIVKAEVALHPTGTATIS